MSDNGVLLSMAVTEQLVRAEYLLDELESFGYVGEVDEPMLLDALGSAGLVLMPDPGLVTENGRVVSHGFAGMIRLGIEESALRVEEDGDA